MSFDMGGGVGMPSERRRMDFDPRPPSKRAPEPVVETAKLKRLVEEASVDAQTPPVVLELLSSGPTAVSASSTVHSPVVLDPIVELLATALAADRALSDTQCLSAIELSKQQVHALEYRTRDQAASSLWHTHRYGRLTSSNFGAILKRKPDGYGGLAEKFLQPAKSLAGIPSIDWGKKNESVARRDYLVYDSSESNPQGLLEIKCPYSARDLIIAEACESRQFFCSILNEKASLSDSQNYYFQVQGAMAVTGASWCDFVVWTTKDMSIERIRALPDKWTQEWCPKLTLFYTEHMLPRLRHLAADKIQRKAPCSLPATPAGLPPVASTAIASASLGTAAATSVPQLPCHSPVAGMSCCKSGCAYAGLLLRLCAQCDHRFHHLCTSHDEGKLCTCCFH